MAFLRIIRPINLLVIVLTMYAIRMYFWPYMDTTNTMYTHEVLDYFLLVFSTVLIAAAGNIINDYFDIKADRINRPERVIIGVTMKRRWAIVWHWILNLIAFGIACYLSWIYDTFWYVFIHLLSINLLWFYSMYFKRRFFVGNFIIAGLTGLVPILCGIHFLGLTTPYHGTNFFSQINREAHWISQFNLKIFFVMAFAFFAFALNLVRELIKDMEDVPGDLELKAKTIPIVLGLKKAKWLAVFGILLILGLATPFLIEGYLSFGQTFISFMWPACIIYLFLLLAITFLLVQSESKTTYKRVNLLLKICMLLGCTLPFYWHYL